MQTKNLMKVAAMLLSLLWFSSCQKDDKIHDSFYDPKNDNDHGFVENNMVLQWNENISNILSMTPAPPPIISRHYTMGQIAVHDALNSIKPKYKTYALMNTRDKTANPDAAVAAAAYWTLKNIDAFLKTFPPNTVGLPLQASGNDWDAWFANSLSTIPDGAAKDAGIALGKKAADAIMSNRAGDNYAEAKVQYLIGNGTIPENGIYRPTISQSPIPANHTGGLPLWGKLMKPFGVKKNDQFRPGPAPSLTSNIYAADYNEVKSLGAREGSSRTEEQSQIANFWWHEGPSVIWNRFSRNAILDKKMDAWKAARLLALVNTGIFDGLLTAFDGMYFYYRWRPESAIRAGETDGNSNTSGITDWLPYVTDIKIGPAPQTPTPPIPEYPNGQASLGSAASEIMKLFFQTDKTQIDLVSQYPPSLGVTRSYSSFSQASAEYSRSMIYAGFNFHYSINAGDEMGRKVGQFVFSNVFTEN